MFISLEELTDGPKITKGGLPIGDFRIEATAWSCGAFVDTSLLKGFSATRDGLLIRCFSSGNKMCSSLKTVSMAWCCRRTGMRFNLKRTWNCRPCTAGLNDPWKTRPTSDWRRTCTCPSYQRPFLAPRSCTRMQSPWYWLSIFPLECQIDLELTDENAWSLLS